MQSFYTHKTFVKNLIFCLYVGSLIGITTSSVYWVIDVDSIAIELGELKDIESEKEECKNEKDSEDKIPLLTGEIVIFEYKPLIKSILLINFQSLTSKEIVTPPPEQLS